MRLNTLIPVSDGCTVEVLGRTGLRYRESGRSMFIDSEVLAPPGGIVIYTATITRWEPPHDSLLLPAGEQHRILANIVAALQGQGIPVDLI